MADKLALKLKEEKSKTPLVDAFVDDLLKKKDKLEKELAPHREYYERHVNDKKFIEARKKIKSISAELGPICNELAKVVRSQGSKGLKIDPGEYNSEATNK